MPKVDLVTSETLGQKMQALRNAHYMLPSLQTSHSRYYSHRTVLTTKSLITLGLIIYELAGLAPLLVSESSEFA